MEFQNLRIMMHDKLTPVSYYKHDAPMHESRVGMVSKYQDGKIEQRLIMMQVEPARRVTIGQVR